ncbi:MAG: histidine kinase [Bacteroidia bacterium]|nr:histidine kinase [Bacteroidia bacterium]
MMLFKKYLINNLFILFWLFTLIGNSQNYLSKQYTTHQGLPDNNVCSILKDNDNRLWIGTYNGLALLKGKSIQIFKKNNGLAHNSCWAIVQDKKGQIWIGTFGGGLSLYKNGKFQNFTTKNGLPSNKIRRLFLRGNDLFIGTANGFSKININDYKIKNYQIKDKSVIYGIKRDFEVLSIIEVNHKIVFNTHSHGIYILKNDTAVALNKTLFSTFSLFKNNDSIYIAKNGHVEREESIISIDVESFLEGKSASKFVKSPNTIFWNFIKTKNNVVFGGADGVEYGTGGLFEINKTATNVTSILGIPSSKIWSLFYDKATHILYVGTLGEGLIVVDLNKTFFRKNNRNTLSFKRNDFYKNTILSDSGLVIEKLHQKINLSTAALYTIVKSEINRLPINYQLNCDGNVGKFAKKGFVIKSLELDKETIFLNTNYGLLKIYFTNDRIQYNLLLYSIQTYKFDKNKLFYYFPYHSLNYIPNIEEQNNKICFDPFKNKNYPVNIIDIHFTKRNKYFISKTEGLYVLKGANYKEFKFPLHYKSMEFVAAHQYSDDQIVLGTIEGDVFLLNDKNALKMTKLFDKKQIIGNTIYKLLSYQDYVLIFTEKGINCIHESSKKSYLIDDEMGVEYKNIHDASFFRSILLLATDKGAYEIDFKKFLLNKTDNNFPYFIDKFIVNDLSVWNKDIFSYDENGIRIELGCEFQLYPNKLLFQYQLNGLKNAKWSTWSEKSTVDLPYVPPGTYDLIIKYKDLSTGATGIKSIKKFEITPPLWQNGYLIIFSILFIGTIGFLYVRRKIDTIKKRELERNNYEKRIVETKMEALQSQMNPHFVFNSLNVIQNFVIKNDVENSITYINNFSKLMRTTLENSSEFKISISDEIKFLKLYVEVQNIRFNHQVKFTTVISPELDKYKKLIPPMLIQPLLENCFEHAFNETVFSPTIVLEIKKESDKIVVSVTDNGIGFKEMSQTKAQSKALKLVAERIKLFNKENTLVFQSSVQGTVVIFEL